MNYMSRAQQKSLLDCYRVHNCKRFHSMNAAIKYTGHNRFTFVDNGVLEQVASTAIAFYSYRTRCFGWYPDADYLVVYPAVINGVSSSTSRQCNRFLAEIVRRDGLTVRELQRAFESLDDAETATYLHNTRVLFDATTNSVLF